MPIEMSSTKSRFRRESHHETGGGFFNLRRINVGRKTGRGIRTQRSVPFTYSNSKYPQGVLSYVLVKITIFILR